MLAGFLLSAPDIFVNLFRMAIDFLFIGALSFLCGEALPRKNFDYREFPFCCFAWEENGKWYLKFKIDRWKDKMPDMSQYIQKTVRKKMPFNRMGSELTYRLVIETCVAELVHWLLIIVSPIFLVLMDGLWGWAGIGLSILGNLPFIMIQRFNRPRMVRVYERQIKHEQRRMGK